MTYAIVKTIRELTDLNGRVALVTGGAGHIGSAVAGALAEMGAAVCVADVSDRRSDVAASIQERYRSRAADLRVDLADERSLQDAPVFIADTFGRLDILVNCAALVGSSHLDGWAVPFERQAADAWREALEVNLTGPFVLTQQCLALLRTSGHGSVINVASIYGIVGPDWRLYDGTAMANPAAYAASKGGLIQFTRWLSTTIAPGVRVNAISPGGVFRTTPEPFLSRYVDRTPLRRMATEEDLIGAAVYLASDLSQYVTGQNLVVDGGWTAW